MLAPTQSDTSTHLRNSIDDSLPLADQLHRTQLFSGLSEVQIQTLAKQTLVQRFTNKSQIPLQNSDTPVVHFLITGRVKVCCATQKSKRPVLYFVNPHELIGEHSILGKKKASEDYVESIEASIVASMPVMPLRVLAQTEPGFAFGLMDLISQRRSTVERRIHHTMFLSNRERLAHVLLDLAEQYGEGPSNHLELRIKLSHQDIAHMIGSTRETVTVVLGKLQQEGLLEIKRRRITLFKLEALRAEVNRSTVASRADELS